MANLTLYHAAPSRSSIVRWMLEEVGEPYNIHLLSLSKGDNRNPDYLAVNPMGKVPALKHGDVVITEAAAICTYLADAFPKAGLSVPIGDPRRGVYLKWLFFGPGCIEPAMIAGPRRARKSRGAQCSATATSTRSWTLSPLRWRRALTSWASNSPHIMGEQFTAADVVVGSGLRWGMLFKLLPERPEFTGYVGRLAQRPALKRAIALDEELAKA